MSNSQLFNSTQYWLLCAVQPFAQLPLFCAPHGMVILLQSLCACLHNKVSVMVFIASFRKRSLTLLFRRAMRYLRLERGFLDLVQYIKWILGALERKLMEWKHFHMARICIISFMWKQISARYLRFSGDATPHHVSPDYKQQSISFTYQSG
ncbi:unnamed protein product [Albugo candida]|uniref:Uncharacterized protein n=1 Tax=Albugo candida TaxID=65357 RepID=A0A024G012_9STRA|nr:unnamed protein product [Albugo candida]|eukprot:CCI39982.1 unnamed protein product [Albugo candida]